MRLKIMLKSGILAVMGLGLAVAYGSYDKTDESLNSIGGSIHNHLGKAGAYVADALTQSVGCAAWIPLVALLCWSMGVWFGRNI